MSDTQYTRDGSIVVIETNGLRMYPNSSPTPEGFPTDMENAFLYEMHENLPDLVTIDGCQVVNGRLVIPTQNFWCNQEREWYRNPCDHEDCHHFSTTEMEAEPELAWLDKQIKDDQ